MPNGINKAEFAFVFVYGLFTMVLGILIVKAIGWEKPVSPYAGQPMIVIAGLYSFRSRPDMLRNNTFWLKRCGTYLLTNVGVFLAMVWLFNTGGEQINAFFPALGVQIVLTWIMLTLPRQFTERRPGEPRLRWNELTLAVMFVLIFVLVELAFSTLGLTD